jgi:4-carboxymuconolactone decarboxylase
MTQSDSNFDKGLATLKKLFGERTGSSPLPATFARHTVAHLFGDVWQDEEMSIEERSMTTCIVLVALNRENEQRLHFRGARNLGISKEKLEAMITHVAHYAGWPVGVSAMAVLNEVWAQMDAES